MKEGRKEGRKLLSQLQIMINYVIDYSTRPNGHISHQLTVLQTPSHTTTFTYIYDAHISVIYFYYVFIEIYKILLNMCYFIKHK
jgi:hypothetical protein